MTLAELIAQREAEISAKLRERNTHAEALMALRSEDATDEAKVAEHRAAKDNLDSEINGLQAKVAEFRAELASDDVADRMSNDIKPAADKPAYDRVARVGQEKHTYSPDNAREGISFLADVVGMTQGSLAAMTRAERHMAEVRVDLGERLNRDVGTGAFAGLVVPQYLTELVAPAVSKKRPLADNCRHVDLPPVGNTVNISRITTATAAAVQATENSPVQETDIDDTLLTVNVRTIAGQQDVSRQLIDRSAGGEQVVIEDLYKRYHENLDYGIINDDGTSGTHLSILSTSGIKAVTYTDSTGTPSEAWGPLWDLQQQIETAVYEAATHFVMHPRRWAFFCSAIGTNLSLVNSARTPLQMLGAEESKQYGSGVRGIIAGLPVIVDANIPTNISSTTDPVLAVNVEELFLWEDPGAPLLIRAEQTGAGSLSVKLVVYGYSAFTAGRYPGAHGKITGSGFGVPTFGIAAA